jgi:ribosomal-protein-alanine N-acetyltransferase
LKAICEVQNSAIARFLLGESKVNLEFKQLSQVERLHFIALHTNPVVCRHMPLSSGNFSDAECAAWIADKERLWEDYGYGPWAFIT